MRSEQSDIFSAIILALPALFKGDDVNGKRPLERYVCKEGEQTIEVIGVVNGEVSFVNSIDNMDRRTYI